MSTEFTRLTALPGLRRSAGVKLILICALVLLMAIPAMFIGAVSYERSSAATDVTRQVSARYGGQQTIIGPILSIPYETGLAGGTKQTGHYIVYPDTAEADFSSVDVEIKSQSLYNVPVFTATGVLTSRFDEPLKKLEAAGAKLRLEDAQFLISISDVRGLKQDIKLRGDQDYLHNSNPHPKSCVHVPAFLPFMGKMLMATVS